MVDLSKVSEAVRKFVDETAKLDGSKKEIDTRQEYDKLGEYLSGNQENKNTHEKEFIQSFMIEYETKTKKQELEAEKKKIEESTTDNVKESVKKIAKRLCNKKKIDADEEAQALALMLRNTKGDLNKADIEYIKNILIENGYKSYIPKEQKQPEENIPKESPQPDVRNHWETGEKVFKKLYYRNTWQGVVEKLFPDLIEEGYSKRELITAFKIYLAQGNVETLYKLKTSAEISPEKLVKKLARIPTRDEMIKILEK